MKVELLVHYLDGMAERYFNKQIEVWWNRNAALKYAMERMIEAFEEIITPVEAMNLFTRPNDRGSNTVCISTP